VGSLKVNLLSKYKTILTTVSTERTHKLGVATGKHAKAAAE